MGARSKRLFGPAASLIPSGAVAIGPVPAGKTWLIKSLRIVNVGGVTRTSSIGIGGNTSAQLVWQAAVGAGTTYVEDKEAPLVLHAGETAYWKTSAGAVAGDLTMTLSGAELDA